MKGFSWEDLFEELDDLSDCNSVSRTIVSPVSVVSGVLVFLSSVVIECFDDVFLDLDGGTIFQEIMKCISSHSENKKAVIEEEDYFAKLKEHEMKVEMKVDADVPLAESAEIKKVREGMGFE